MNYQIVLLPLLCGIISQLIKIFLYLKKQKFNWFLLAKLGGMPSTHTALTVGLVATLGIFHGITAEFSIALVLALIVIRDATGLRMQSGKHAVILNKILFEKKETIVLDENLGHSFIQILAGAIIGVLIPLIWFFLS